MYIRTKYIHIFRVHPYLIILNQKILEIDYNTNFFLFYNFTPCIILKKMLLIRRLNSFCFTISSLALYSWYGVVNYCVFFKK